MKLDEDDVLSVPPGIAEQMPIRFKKVGGVPPSSGFDFYSH